MIKWLALLAGDIEMNERGNENEWKSGKRAAAIELCPYLHDFFFVVPISIANQCLLLLHFAHNLHIHRLREEASCACRPLSLSLSLPFAK